MQRVTGRVFAVSAIWKMLESLSTKGISVFISIILARLLAPENYGVVALTSVFINFSTMLVQGGLTTALIRQESVDDVDYSNAFFFCLTIATICYCAFFVGAPYIASYYKEPILIPVLRVQMISLFLCALGTIRNAIVVRQFRFKELCAVNCIANIVSGLLGIGLAYNGYGVWALVIYTLFRDGLCTFCLFFFVRWRIRLLFSFARIKKLISFSGWLLLATIFDFCGNNIFNTVFGKHYSMAELGHYNKGMQLPELVCLHTFGAITSVMLPAMSESQSEEERLKTITRKIVSLSAYVIFPLMGGLAIIGRNAVIVLFTEKWLLCVPILWAACLYYGCNIFRSINMQLIYATGKSKIGVKIELCRFLMLVCSVTIGVKFFDCSIYELALLSAFITMIVVSITQYYVKRTIDYSYSEWIKDIKPSIFLTIGMGSITTIVGMLSLPTVIMMFFQIATGIISYIVLSWIFNIKSFKYIVQIIIGFSRK